MNEAPESLSYAAQLIGFVASVLGTLVGVGAFVAAWIAAARAKSARQAAIRLGRIAQLGDLIADMQELQAMLARTDFASIAGKANLLTKTASA